MKRSSRSPLANDLQSLVALEPILGAPREAIELLQFDRLRSTIQHVHANNPHYRQKCDERGVEPDDLRSLADLARFPFTTKADLRDAYPFGYFSVPRERADSRILRNDR